VLLEQGYEVYGVVRRSSTLNFERIAHIQDRIELLSADLTDQNSLFGALQQSEPRRSTTWRRSRSCRRRGRSRC
jgi:GDPmannose 4,6-dehydratase